MHGVKVNIKEHFKNIYSKIYNSVDDAVKVAEINSLVNDNIDDGSFSDVTKINELKVKKAISRIKAGKNYPAMRFTSDCIQINSKALHTHLVALIRFFLVHGHISLFLLLATLIPIIKDRLGVNMYQRITGVYASPQFSLK